MHSLPRILFNTWSGALFNPGGGEVQLLETRRALREKGYQISLYNQWEPQRDIDIFHQFSIQLGVNYVINEYKNLKKKIALSTILWDCPPPNSFAFEYIRDLFLQADVLLTNSEVESKKLSDWFGVERHKFVKTRNSISNDYLTAGKSGLFRNKYDLCGDFVLSVANIDRRKNTFELIRACHELDLPLVLIGSIRDPQYYLECENSGFNFTYLGPISDVSLLKSAYLDARVFALPSLCETPSIAALEAASQGASIAITNQGSAMEYFGDDVQYIDPLDFASIKSGIEAAWDSAKIKGLSQRICAEFTWEQTALDIAGAYDKLLG